METLRKVLEYDQDTGLFTWIKNDIKSNQWHSRFEGRVAGHRDAAGYVIINFESKSYKAHRIAWYFMTGGWPDKQIDHIDRIKDNNKWKNLRLASNQENQFNTIHQKNSITGVRGVGLNRITGRWYSRITHNGKTYWLGYCYSQEEAVERYEKKAKELFGNFYSTYSC